MSCWVITTHHGFQTDFASGYKLAAAYLDNKEILANRGYITDSALKELGSLTGYSQVLTLGFVFFSLFTFQYYLVQHHSFY